MKANFIHDFSAQGSRCLLVPDALPVLARLLDDRGPKLHENQ